MDLQKILHPSSVGTTDNTKIVSSSSLEGEKKKSRGSARFYASSCRPAWIAPFLFYLHQMLSQEDQQILRWTENGLAFQILDKEAMTNRVLPKYFNNKNFASFQRQLNYFGFRKWSKSRSKISTYSREHFTRDNIEELALVKRQSKKSKKARDAKERAYDEEPIRKRSSSGEETGSPRKCPRILPKVGASSRAMVDSHTSSPLFAHGSSRSPCSQGVMMGQVQSGSYVGMGGPPLYAFIPQGAGSTYLPPLSPQREEERTNFKLPPLHKLTAY